MTLTLEIVGPQASQLGAAARKIFKAAGGSIGRSADNDWVIPDAYISGHHARVHFRDGRYLLEDTSTNGVFVKTPGNRLPKGELHLLQSGDRVFIDAYEIKVTLAEPQTASAPSNASPLSDLFGSSAMSAAPSAPSSPSTLPIPDDPFGMSDPFGSEPPRQPSASRETITQPLVASVPLGGAGTGEEFSAEQIADPLLLLGLGAKPKLTAAPKAADLARHSPMTDHYMPPPPPPSADLTTPLPGPSHAVADALIPDDYDPLDDFRPAAAPPKPTPPSRPTPGGGQRVAPGATKTTAGTGVNLSAAAPLTKSTPPKVPLPQPTRAASPSPIPQSIPPAPAPVSMPAPASNRAATVDTSTTQSQRVPSLDFAAMLAGAGVPDAQFTPDLAENFGRILHIVVAGLMDVLRSRERIKDEFRMRMTSFKVADNNPLKFSANVEDALHNLLVKRNAAYLGPVEAFDDAFRDVRNHQMAMLAGMRVAFDAMLQSFDPEQLQEQFGKQLKRGGLLSAPAKLKYWDLYRERFHDMVKDPEAAFRELFGEEFARAYEEQLERLKVVNRNQKQ